MIINKFDLQNKCKDLLLKENLSSKQKNSDFNIFLYQGHKEDISLYLESKKYRIIVNYSFLTKLTKLFQTDKIRIIYSSYEGSGSSEEYVVMIEIADPKIEIDWNRNNLIKN